MDAFHHFEVDHARNLVRLTLAGFFDESSLQTFAAARTTAFAKLRCAPNSHLVLVDIRDMKIQSQEVVARFGELLSDRRFFARRLAFVVGSTLARLQLLRALKSRQAQTFTSSKDAEAWLFAGDAIAA